MDDAIPVSLPLVENSGNKGGGERKESGEEEKRREAAEGEV